jgi:hypothetical protein
MNRTVANPLTVPHARKQEWQNTARKDVRKWGKPKSNKTFQQLNSLIQRSYGNFIVQNNSFLTYYHASLTAQGPIINPAQN